METSSEISIITATHYRPELLRRCIKNIQRQTFKNYEHIIVSDKCPYARGVFEEFSSDTRIKFFETDGEKVDNVGAIAKNKGIENSSSELICYCDDDNILLPNHLEVLYNYIKKNNLDLVYSCGWYISLANIDELKNKPLYEENLPEIPMDLHNQKIENDKYSINISDDYKIINHDMLNCIHTKKAIEQIGGWSPKSIVGYGEDRHLMNLFNNSTFKIEFINDITCIYYHKKA